jgi:hypothetical protein
MAEKVTAWLGGNGQLYRTEEAARQAEISAAASWLSNCAVQHLIDACTGKTECRKTDEALALLLGAKRAAEKAKP